MLKQELNINCNRHIWPSPVKAKSNPGRLTYFGLMVFLRETLHIEAKLIPAETLGPWSAESGSSQTNSGNSWMVKLYMLPMTSATQRLCYSHSKLRARSVYSKALAIVSRH